MNGQMDRCDLKDGLASREIEIAIDFAMKMRKWSFRFMDCLVKSFKQQCFGFDVEAIKLNLRKSIAWSKHLSSNALVLMSKQ